MCVGAEEEKGLPEDTVRVRIEEGYPAQNSQ